MIKIAESDIAARKIFSEQRGRIRTGVLTGDSHETLHRNTDLRARQCAGHIVKAVFVVTPSHWRIQRKGSWTPEPTSQACAMLLIAVAR